MDDSGLILFLISLVVSRIIAERGYRTLDADEKLRLMDGFSRSRAYSYIPLIILVGAYFYALKQSLFDPQILTICYLAVMFIWVIARQLWCQKKLKELEMPPTYRRNFTVSQVISFLGVAWFLYLTFNETIS